MKGVGIIPNWQKDNAPKVVEKVRSFFEGEGIPVIVMERDDENRKALLSERLKDWRDKVEMLIVVGGDGTILKVGRDLALWGLPILGINVGHKGFLAEMEVEGFPKYLQYIISGDYLISERIMLEAAVMRKGKKISAFRALNDVVITKGPFSRIIHLDAYIDREFLESYTGDGIIISTPTGSTGYSLSAGGPIVNPVLDVILITPICPHSFSNRSVIVDGSEVIRINVFTKQSDIVLTVDGQVGFVLSDEDHVIVSRSPIKTLLVDFKNRSFYSLLGLKLKE
ncbi:MAG: NAD(+)/NADH kinase [Dethiobacteria bacterium]